MKWQTDTLIFVYARFGLFYWLWSEQKCQVILISFRKFKQKEQDQITDQFHSPVYPLFCLYLMFYLNGEAQCYLQQFHTNRLFYINWWLNVLFVVLSVNKLEYIINTLCLSSRYILRGVSRDNRINLSTTILTYNIIRHTQYARIASFPFALNQKSDSLPFRIMKSS